MKQLDPIIKKGDFNYKLIKRNNFKAIYSQYLENKLIAYEIFYIPKHNGFKMFDKEIEPSEYFPKDEYFGKTVWSLQPCLGKALERYEQLNETE